MEESNGNVPDKSSLQILQEINSGSLDSSLLDKVSRQQCVELLDAEGYTHAHIAQVLKCSERTITRDMTAIKKRNKLFPNASFSQEFIGDVVRKGMYHHSQLVRQARSKDASIAEKIHAEYAAWRVLKELVEKLQSLGYLPSMPQEVVGDIYHHLGDNNEVSLADIKKMVGELEVVTKEEGTAVILAPEIEKLKRRIEKAEILAELGKITEQQEQIIKKEEQNDRSS